MGNNAQDGRASAASANYQFEVPVPAGLLPPKAGVGEVISVIVADAVRQVDYQERECAFVKAAPRKVVEEVMDKLLAVLEDDWVLESEMIETAK